MVRPRVDLLFVEAVVERLREIPQAARILNAGRKLLVFCHAAVLRRLLALKMWFLRRQSQYCLDKFDDWMRMVFLNRLSDHSPGFFSTHHATEPSSFHQCPEDTQRQAWFGATEQRSQCADYQEILQPASFRCAVGCDHFKQTLCIQVCSSSLA